MSSAAIGQLRDQLADGGRAFLRWWLAELEGMVPPGLRRRLPKRQWASVWDLSGETPRLWRQGEGWRTLDEGRAAKAADKARTADVILDPALVFRKEIVLPRMSASQARAALRLQLNRHVPFKAADVIFDCRVTGEDAQAGMVTAELALIRRTDIAHVQDKLSAYGVTPRRIGLESGGKGADIRFNFHDQSEISRFTRMHGLLTLMAGVLALATLFAIEDRRAAELTAWRDAAAEQARAAAEVQALRTDVTMLEERTAFLEQQWQAPPRVALMETLSKALPDGTWLESIEITGAKIRLTGYSDKASSVPEWLQKTGEVTDLKFVSGVSSTAKPGVDRFDVEGVVP